MELSRCIGCALPVLELEGQFEKLDSLFIYNGSLPAESAGWWHALCLASSELALNWYQARLLSFRSRGYQQITESPHWNVMRDPNRGKVIAFGRHAELLNLSRGSRRRARAVVGGRIYPKVDDEVHLEIEDATLIAAIKGALTSSGSYPLRGLLEQMDLLDRIVHPESLEHGEVRFEQALQHYWGRAAVSARFEYGVFVPTELESYVGEYIR